MPDLVTSDPLGAPRRGLPFLRQPPFPPSAKAASRDVEASDGLAEMTVAEINEQRRQEEAERANRLYDLPMSDADGPRFDEPVMDRFTAEIPDDLAVNLKDG
jgi:hypothetical protein